MYINLAREPINERRIYIEKPNFYFIFILKLLKVILLELKFDDGIK